MKKVFLICTLVATTFLAKAQDGRQNAVKINPLSLIFLTGNVSYERAVNAKQSMQLGANFSGFELSGVKYSGWGVTPEYRVYFGQKSQALDGIYVAPFLRYQNFTLKDKDTNDEATLSAFGGGAVIGWQNVSRSGFTVNIFAGPGYNSHKLKTSSAEDEFDVKAGLTGFGLRTGVTLGFAF